MARLATAPAMAAAAASCSSGPGPAATVETFMHAMGDKNPDAACGVVSTGGRPLQGDLLAQCRVGLQKVLAEVRSEEFAALRQAKVTGASVNGDKATVRPDQITQVPAGYANTIELVRIDGRWYIDPTG